MATTWTNVVDGAATTVGAVKGDTGATGPQGPAGLQGPPGAAVFSDVSGNVATATGGAASRTLAARFADVVNVKDFGAVGDGVADDTAALQAALDYGTSNGRTIYLPVGDYKVSGALVTGSKPVSIRGCGPFASRIIQTASSDLFQHGLGGVVYYATFALDGVGLYRSTAGTGYAIRIVQNTSSGNFSLTNVRFGSYTSTFNWQGFVHATGTSVSVFRDVRAEGGPFSAQADWPALTQVGFTFQSNDNTAKAFVITFDNCTINTIQHAVLCEVNGVPGNSGSVEGVIFNNCCGRTNTGAWFKVSVPNSVGAWWPPYYVFNHCNFEGLGAWVDIDAGSEFHMHGCLHYIQASVSGAVAADLIRLGTVRQAYIIGNTFYLYASALVDNIVRVGATSRNVTIADNSFILANSSVTISSGVRVEPGVTGLRVADNRFTNWTFGVRKEWDGANALSAALSSPEGAVTLSSNSTTALRATSPANGVNYVEATGTAAGSAPTLAPAGTDTNITLVLKGKGTGRVQMTSPVIIPGYLFASLPAAADYSSCTIRVFDRLHRLATSDGTNWRFTDGTIVT